LVENVRRLCLGWIPERILFTLVKISTIYLVEFPREISPYKALVCWRDLFRVLIRWSSALKAVLQGVSALEGSLQRVGPLEDSRLTVRLCGGRSSVAMGPQGSWGVGPSSRHQLPRTPCERYTRSPSTPSATPARNFPSLFGGAREFCTISHTKSFVGKDFPANSPCEWFRC